MTLNAKSIVLGVALLTAGATFNGWWYSWTIGREIRTMRQELGGKMDRMLEGQERATERLLQAQERSTERILRSTDQVLDRLDQIQETLSDIREDQIRILERAPDETD